MRNPGPYPTTVDADKVIRERQIAEHKAECIEYETYLGVENFIRIGILHAKSPRKIEMQKDSDGKMIITPP